MDLLFSAVSLMLLNASSQVLDVSHVNRAHDVVGFVCDGDILLKGQGGVVLATHIQKKISSIESWEFFFNEPPVQGELFTVNSQPRLVLEVRKSEFVFADIPWDMA